MNPHHRLGSKLLMVIFLLGFGIWLQAAPESDLFRDGAVLNIGITLSTDALESLRQFPRTPVRATIREETNLYENVSLHLKGSKGSFRPIDDKPAITLDFSRYAPGRKFHSLRKLHLNNSVEDPGFLNEQLGGEIFRAAGIPAPRVTHAHVALNSRKLGFYVLIEGFTEDFLAAHFRNAGPDLYEPLDGPDIDSGMKRNSVTTLSTKDDKALSALVDAALEPNLSQRWARLQASLDIDQFISFMALEVILCHRDGYSMARNNYRLYHDIDSGNMVFVPHGMDQLFGKFDFPWEPAMAGTVAKALMETPSGRARYEQLFPTLMTNCFEPSKLTNRVTAIVKKLGPALEPDEYRALQEESHLVIERIVARRADLERQLAAPRPQPLVFANGIATLSRWEPLDVPDGGKMDTVALPDRSRTLHIKAGPATMGSWRTKWILSRGSYRFEGKAKVAQCRPLPYGQHQGARLRTTASDTQSADLNAGDIWDNLQVAFEVTSPSREVEFVCEFRASAGDVWFDMESLRVTRIK